MAQKKQKRKVTAKEGKAARIASRESLDKQWKQLEKKFGRSDLERMKKKMVKELKPVKKSAARRIVGKGLSKLIPGAGVAMIASEVVKGVSKATCSKKGGKWVNGKCKGAKKDTRKITNPPVRDPKSKR
jgi:hypothetical protein